MPIRWAKNEEKSKRKSLEDLYITKNLTIFEIGQFLGVSKSTVYKRLLRLNITPDPSKKIRFKNKNKITLPKYSVELAELVGILLGDGHISPTQVMVNLGSKESSYAAHVGRLLERAFGIPARQSIRRAGYIDVYIGSVDAVRFLMKMGFSSHKVRDQISVPQWIFLKPSYQRACLRGLFDTDGSIYRLHNGWQISFCNRSLALLDDVRNMLMRCGFHPSHISGFNLYVTQKRDMVRFVRDISFASPTKRTKLFLARAGTQVVNEGRL